MYFVAIALAQSVSIPPMDSLKASETLQAAKLSSPEIKQICEQLETPSFDVPDSWEKELRGRRVSLGNEDGLVIQGTELLCGGTGNCQTWVLRRSPGSVLLSPQGTAGREGSLQMTVISCPKCSSVPAGYLPRPSPTSPMCLGMDRHSAARRSFRSEKC